MYFLIRLSHIKRIDQANENRVIGPKAAIDKYIEPTGLIFGMIDWGERTEKWCRSCCETYIDECVVIVPMVGIF